MPVTYEIHPAIGIARLGSSRLLTGEGYFLGPEPGVSLPVRYRDSTGFLKRQAARFRLFACWRDENGNLRNAEEITGSGRLRKLTWTVQLTNRKGVARRRYVFRRGRRNHATGDDSMDRALIIDPGPRSVDTAGEWQAFDSASFRTTAVKLGEIVMEPDGRLLVLGGHGYSGSDPVQPRLTIDRGNFADNDGWFDDTSDGPVSVTAELADGETFQSTAWVVVAPPDYAPGITNLVTLYDVLYDCAVARGIRAFPTDGPDPVSFVRHVKPILQRAISYRWVNRHAAFGIDHNGRAHGPGGGAEFSRFWAALADSSARAANLRTAIAGGLRDPDPRSPRPNVPVLVPRLSNAEMVCNDPNNVLPLTRTQFKIMKAWAIGDFINDLGHPFGVEELLPDALDRVALEACVGGALFPGIEVNDSISNPKFFKYGEPFRINPTAVYPGGLTQQNAVPWQADYHLCRWEELGGVMPKRLGWWPAQRPDDVYTSDSVSEMVPWARGLGDDFQDMIDRWDRLGILVDRGTAEAPLHIESERDVGLLGQ